MEETVELIEHRAIIGVPENTVALTLTAKVYHDGEIVSVSKEYGMSEIRAMFEKADSGYIDDDDRFVITDKGIAWLEELEHERNERP